MYYLSNTLFGRISIIAVRVFYKINYKYTLPLRKAYLKVSVFFRDFYKILIYGTVDMFDEVVIETTTYCNRKCSYCPNSVFDRGQKNNEKLMPVKLFKKIIDDLKDINYKGRIYPHLYGEPLLDERLKELMHYAYKKLPQAEITIHTNGDFLNIDILNKLYEAGVRSYFITLHGDVTEGAKRIKKLMRYIEMSKKRIKIFCQVMNDNTALSTRVGLVQVKNVNKDDFQCASPFCIDYKGDVLICCHDYLGVSNSFGNVGKDKIMEIWQKKYFKRIRKQLAKKVFSLELCKRCQSLHESSN